MRAEKTVVLSVERSEARTAQLKVGMRVVSWDLR